MQLDLTVEEMDQPDIAERVVYPFWREAHLKFGDLGVSFGALVVCKKGVRFLAGNDPDSLREKAKACETRGFEIFRLDSIQ